MSDRFFVETPICGDRVTLGGPEAHHLLHVMRARAGDRVVLFDGSGAEFPAVVARLGRAEVELDVLAREAVDREAPVAVVLGVALPKGDRQRWLVEKAVELGVRRLVPLVTARAVAQPEGQALARLRRTVIEASKQCGRNRLMEIAEAQRFGDFVATGSEASCRLIAHPAPGAMSVPLLRQKQCLIAVGPEGGFTEDESAQAGDAGWQAVDLGRRILRVETAALMLAALVIGSEGRRVG
jgi:16S rRNA (uracil1498-N3)-methyltransferase